MKVVILAAGRGKRMGEMAKEIPKPALKYKGKSLIHHKLDELPAAVEEVIIVVGHLGDYIVNAVGGSYNGIPISYVWQQELLGTAHSLFMAKEKLNTPFMVLMGDDLYAKDDLQQMIDIYKEEPESRWVALVQVLEEKMSAGKCLVDENGRLYDIVEDPTGESPSNLMNTGAYLLTPSIFELPMVKLDGKEEFGLPQTFVQAAKEKNIRTVNAQFWKRVTAPEDLEE